MVKPIISTLLLWTLVVRFSHSVDVGFEFQYTTNRQEHLNFPVHFEHPLPTWLKGVYVSNLEYIIIRL